MEEMRNPRGGEKLRRKVGREKDETRNENKKEGCSLSSGAF